MNVFMHGAAAAGFDVLKAKIKREMAGPAGEFVDEYRVTHLGIGKIMFCPKVDDFKKMGAFMSNPAEVHWDKDHD